MMPMREVSTMRQIQTKDHVAGLQYRGVGGLIRLRSRVGLHVDVLRAKEFLRPLARQIFHHVDKLASPVIALAGITFRILVGKYGSGRLQHSLADKVLRSDQLQTFMLTASFVVNSIRNL